MGENETINKVETVEGIYEDYSRIFEKEEVICDTDSEPQPYYLEKKFNQPKDCYRIVLTPLGPVAVGSLFRNIWDITTQRDEGSEDYINEKNVNKNNRDSLLLEELKKILEEYQFNDEKSEIYRTINGVLYTIIPLSLKKSTDIEQLRSLLYSRKLKSLQQRH